MSSSFARRLSEIGSVHPLVMLTMIPAGITSIVLTAVTGHVFWSMHQSAQQRGFALHTSHVSAALYTVTGLECLLGIVLVLRGAAKQLADFFSTVSAQIVIILHALFPAIIVTALWAARAMIDALVTEKSVADFSIGNDPYVKASYSLLTATMVFVNIYSMGVLAIIFANTGRFIAGNPSLSD
jgi:hypothetical protein